MKVIIIEDEHFTAKDLQRTLELVDPAIEVIAVYTSVADINHNYKSLALADLIFSDIQLGDGLSIDALVKYNTTVPIIFCTAYDHYALAAFKSNGIEYLLKPFSLETVRRGVEKFRMLKGVDVKMPLALPRLAEEIKQKVTLKSSLIIQRGDKIIPLAIAEVALFNIENGIVYAHTFGGQKHSLSELMDYLEEVSGPAFFRVNRQSLLNRKAVKDASRYFDRKLLVNLRIDFHEKILVGKVKSSAFINWLTEV